VKVLHDDVLVGVGVMMLQDQILIWAWVPVRWKISLRTGIDSQKDMDNHNISVVTNGKQKKKEEKTKCVNDMKKGVR